MTTAPTPLSVFLLTFNSEQYLDALLSRVRPLTDDLLVVDSGSTDGTLALAERHGCRVLYRPFDDFRNQRIFALDACRHRVVLMLDSDEVPDETFVASLHDLKQRGFPDDAYEIRRNWFVMGRPVHCLYPVPSPDYVVRVVKKDIVSFDDRSRLVHEQPFGHRTLGRVGGAVAHFTFGSKAELYRKLDQYTTLAARDLVTLNQVPGGLKRWLLPLAIWAKWYLVKGGYKDGSVGWMLGAYAYRYTKVKLRKARALTRQASESVPAQRATVPNKQPVA
jgi:glycosyltransferase involved in cell wall biosynthesis